MSCGVCLLEVSDNLLESLSAGMLLESLLHNIVALLVALCLNLLAKVVIVNLVAVLTLHIRAQLLHELILHLAHRLDSLVGCLQRVQEISFLNLLHLALNHHDVVLRRTYHEVHVGRGHLLECRVDDILSVDTCYTYL